jgi:hypothetical protein
LATGSLRRLMLEGNYRVFAVNAVFTLDHGKSLNVDSARPEVSRNRQEVGIPKKRLKIGPQLRF